ncbi:MAG: hypothetical protein KDJ35_07420 [Alphaproteobacteria bacterium]|nr:hypothetical protein [Alphaproteobacteria bacterium]
MILTIGSSAHADGEIVQEPICFVVINDAPHMVLGSFVTDTYTKTDGSIGRHRSNFRLQESGAVDKEKGYPTDRAEFCSYGPFFEGRKLEFTIRTLFPVFSCKTNIESGPITIKSIPRKDDPMGGFDYTATCYD